MRNVEIQMVKAFDAVDKAVAAWLKAFTVLIKVFTALIKVFTALVNVVLLKIFVVSVNNSTKWMSRRFAPANDLSTVVSMLLVTDVFCILMHTSQGK